MPSPDLHKNVSASPAAGRDTSNDSLHQHAAASPHPDAARTPDEIRQVQRAAFMDGVRALAPASLAIGVWGLVTGVAMVKVGLTQSLALGMTLVVYAGSAQLTSLPLILAGAPIWLIFLASFVVNLRFVIFSAAFHPFFRRYSAWKRLVMGYFSSDIGFVLFMPRYSDAPVKGTAEQTGFFWGVAAGNWLVWQVSSIVGVVVGALIPAAWSLEFAAVLALMSIVVPMAKGRPVLAAIVAAAVVGWAGQPLPLRLGLVAAVIAGVTAGMLVERAEARGAARTGAAS